MILYFADRHLNILGQASTNLPQGIIITDDLKTEEVETGITVLEFDLNFTKETRSKVEEWAELGNYVLCGSDDEKKLFTIIDTEIDTKKQTANIYAEDEGLDLLNEVVEPYAEDQAHPISYYVNKYASGAGWTIGINEVEGLTRQLTFDDEETTSSRLLRIAEAFGNCELSYSFRIDGLRVVKKFINIHEERGSDTGIQLRLNKEIDSIITTKSIANLATALKVTGGTPEDSDEAITLLNYEYDDGNFYIDGYVLKSRKALEKWSRYLWNNDDSQQQGGHIVKQYSDESLSQAVLLDNAIAELKSICDMEINYEADIKELPDNVKVGDRVNIIDDAGEVYLSSRVLVLETSEANNTKKAILGEHLIKKSGISSKVAKLAAQFSKMAYTNGRLLKASNAAKADANEAKTLANNAATEAQSALTKAQAAESAASTATQSASQAQAAANAAQASVESVEAQVSDIETIVDNANTAANNAHIAAAQAQAKAEEASTAVANAVIEAGEAKTAAGTAQSTAENALTKAETAQTESAAAKTTAEQASSVAAGAKADAQKAQEDINTFAENLETVESTMKADYSRKTDLTEATASLQTQITRNANEISTTASRVTVIDETANNAAELAEQAQSEAQAAQETASQATAEAQAAQSAADTAQAAAEAAQAEADNAKSAAATAQIVADKAKEDLEAAQADLATVQGRVDATEEEIAAAEQAVANAQAAAEKAQTDANTAATKAQEAQGTAQTAATNAAAAQTTATNAANKAEQAKEAAEQAQNDATAAKQAAQSAQAIANAAQETANTAKTNAQNAQTKADEAFADAVAAAQAASAADAKAAQAATDLATAQQNLANVTSRVDATEEEVAAAQEAVETAQAAAEQAVADAATAQSTANTAKENAATAQTAANKAKIAADNAQDAADAAQEAADQAQADVNALTLRVTTAETAITQNSEQIALRATKTEVEHTLGGYYNKTQTDALIKVESDKITSQASEIDSLGGRMSTVEQTAGELTVSLQTTNENVADALARGIEYIEGTQTAATNAWTGKTTDSSLVKGKTIAYKLTYAGNGSAATLNLTLAGGGTTGAKGIRRLDSTVTTNYAAGSVIHMTYDGTYWRITDYNSDTYDRVRYNKAIKCGTTAIVAANIIVGADGLYKHLKAGTAFDVSYPILYATSAISASGTGTNNYLCYSFTVTTTQSITLTAYKPVYIKGTLSGTIFTPVSTTPLTQTVPTSNDGYYYILLGHAITSTTMYLTLEHPIYTYFNGSFKAVSQIAVEAAKTATNYMNFSSSGLCIGDMTASTLGRNINIGIEQIDIKNGSTVLASYQDDAIYLGMNADAASIYLCGDSPETAGAQLWNDGTDDGWNRLCMHSPNAITQTTNGLICHHVASTPNYGETEYIAEVEIKTQEPWTPANADKHYPEVKLTATNYSWVTTESYTCSVEVLEDYIDLCANHVITAENVGSLSRLKITSDCIELQSMDGTIDFVSTHASFNSDVSVGERTGYNDGKDGIHLDAEGFIQIQRNNSSYHPYLAFYLNGSTSTSDGQIRVNQTTGYMQFLQAGRYVFDARLDVTGSIVGSASIYTNSKTSVSDGVEGTVIGGGNIYLQNNDGSPSVQFFGNGQTDYGASIYYTVDDDYLNFGSATRYVFKSNTEVSGTLYVTGNMRIGHGSAYTTTRTITTDWKDESSHNLVERNADGLTSAFGWAGSSSYATVTKIRGRTCQYQNSSGTTALSDERLKKDFTVLDKWDSFYDAIEPCAFRMKNGNSGRFHVGFKAQQVEQALLDNELTTQDFAGFVKLQYRPDEDDPEGNAVFQEAGINEGDDEYGLIYTEFIALNTHQIQKLKAEIETLKYEIETLKKSMTA